MTGRLLMLAGALVIAFAVWQDPPLTLFWIPGTWLLMRGWVLRTQLRPEGRYVKPKETR